MPKFAKLIDQDGRAIHHPELVEGSITWSAMDSMAQAWSADGRTMLCEMVSAHVVWVTATSMRIDGMEPVSHGISQFRAMSWQLVF
ncbi:hypothetical protein [Leeia oryzae]|uniref:hypothetical protein n=1 Tax=Leeia oryzae TaxID=356662 RepID=UPI0003803377|nr:hypothetical protein [Leeia oryzae]